MNCPLLYQINTRTWLHELSERAAQPVTLASIPEQEFQFWRARGFTHLWLMGVWKTGPLARAHALKHFRTNWHLDPDLAGFSEADAIGSPFAIERYEVSEEFGGDHALAIFREHLHQHGLKLLLDFVPNHVGLDHHWLQERPELFVQSAEPMKGAFKQKDHSHTWLAHGRDPWFPPWTDTAQLDYRFAATRREMIGVLRSIVPRCDGMRCDMAMLLLNNVFAKTWRDFPVSESMKPASMEEEFWSCAIETIKAEHPQFLFMAEAYWDLEPKLQNLGFDFTYDKRVYDHLLNSEYNALQDRLTEANISFLNRSVHFLENHDEARAAKLFTYQDHLPAALLTLALPGMRLIHHGQMEGFRIHQRIQLRRRVAEIPDATIAKFYERLLTALRQSLVGRGSPTFLGQIETLSSVIGITWTNNRHTDVAIVNLSGEAVAAKFDWPFPARRTVLSLFTTSPESHAAISSPGSILSMDLAPHAARLLRFE